MISNLAPQHGLQKALLLLYQTGSFLKIWCVLEMDLIVIMQYRISLLQNGFLLYSYEMQDPL